MKTVSPAVWELIVEMLREMMACDVSASIQVSICENAMVTTAALILNGNRFAELTDALRPFFPDADFNMERTDNRNWP